MELSIEDRMAILEEIDEFTGVPELAPDEITVRMYAEHKGITISKAASRLEAQWIEGKLNRREVLHEGKKKNAYSIADPPGVETVQE